MPPTKKPIHIRNWSDSDDADNKSENKDDIDNHNADNDNANNNDANDDNADDDDTDDDNADNNNATNNNNSGCNNSALLDHDDWLSDDDWSWSRVSVSEPDRLQKFELNRSRVDQSSSLVRYRRPAEKDTARYDGLVEK